MRYVFTIWVAILGWLVAGCGATANPKQSSRTAASRPARDQQLLDASWVSANEGWVLSGEPCAALGSCARLAHTTNGGRSWQALTGPRAAVTPGAFMCSRHPCVSDVLFADPQVGYLYGPSLLMTRDGGVSWRAVRGTYTETLALADGRAWRVAFDHTGCPGPCNAVLQEARIGARAWHTLKRLGSVLGTQIVSSGSSLLVAIYGNQAGGTSAQAVLYRSTDGGGSWRVQTDPCSGRAPDGSHAEQDLTDLATARGGFFAGLCSPHTGFGTFVVTSTDGGRSWITAGAVPARAQVSLLAAASPTTLAAASGPVGGRGSFTARLLISSDGGHRWRPAAANRQQITLLLGAPAWLGFQTPREGRWIASPKDLWVTTDGGSRWRRAAAP